MATPVPKLFQSIQVGTTNLQHRVVLAPMKRARADERHVLGELGLEYYKQRTSTSGTLAISEGTCIVLHACGCTNVPGIWSDEQIAAWKLITDAVHANGSFIYLQLWVLGRAAEGDVLRKAGGYEVIALSAIALEGRETPRALTFYVTAAENAVLKAGFDGVEIQTTGGYFLDQFIQPVTNTRTDEYGGSLENRLRFVLEITDAMVKAIGANKVGIRISPYLKIQGMGMPDPIPTYTKLVASTRDSYHDLAPSTKFLRDIWGNRPYITNGSYERDTAIEVVEKEGGLVSFGRYFISNPDLPRRLKENIELALDDPKTWWAQGAEGYTDYPFATEVKPEV
ncbi:FMN-linked oxidoreductase [Lactarius akahatsu]|uniref:FMN-linked oxidoreductase n=1 Tax=Lactarius akahatsu TaxID=416441 RepID=A0AAD4L6C7_9AGAM|nr:FMN-linked oxidoreductase [Lactarius akahatsu]